MVHLHFQKLSRFDRIDEPCTIAIPLPRGRLTNEQNVTVFDGDQAVPTQSQCTATWPDGSAKWLLVHFLASLPANDAKDFICRLDTPYTCVPKMPLDVHVDAHGAWVRTAALRIDLAGPGTAGLFRRCEHGSVSLSHQQCLGPAIVDAEGHEWTLQTGDPPWRIVESGPVRAVLETYGKHQRADGTTWLDYVARVCAYAGKPWIKIDYRIMHREPDKELKLQAVKFAVTPHSPESGSVRTALATSNYTSHIQSNDRGKLLRHVIDAEQLIYEANEQVPETLYGTFWADWNDPDRGGLCVTIHQAHQNFPKALVVDESRLEAWLLPPESDSLTLMQGMAKTHRLFLHFHDPQLSLEDMNVRSLQFQMPDRPTLTADVYRDANVIENVWVDQPVAKVERLLIDLADTRSRGYGMLHWGDGPDDDYTAQGRGRGDLVWTNNEYDLPHQSLLMYARTGERRFLDYLLVAAEHWMDVDVCHHSDDPLRHQGQIVHSARHATGPVTISHEWVEGLLDYYHQTGDAFALQTAVGIGANVMRHLRRPALQKPAASAARETGWALRTLVALYVETHDEKWLIPAKQIVDQFETWQSQYGAWVAPYTNHTLVRVPFMISIAVCSLMRYYRIREERRIARMIVDAMEDLIDQCLMTDGRFYYKELPSLQRRVVAAPILEGLAYAYEISTDLKFLLAGFTSLDILLAGELSPCQFNHPKYRAGDAVILPKGLGPKTFALNFPGIMAFYRAAVEAGLLKELPSSGAIDEPAT